MCYVSFSPWRSSRPAVTVHPALCVSEPPARPRCPTEKDKKNSIKSFYQSGNQKNQKTNQTMRERDKLSCLSMNQSAALVIMGLNKFAHQECVDSSGQEAPLEKMTEDRN